MQKTISALITALLLSIPAAMSAQPQPASTRILSSIVTLPVTRQGFSTQVTGIATKADANRNGLLEPAEQAASAGKLLAAANLGAQLPECRGQHFLVSLNKNVVANQPVRITEIIKNADKVFRFLDSNNDGTLTAAEEAATIASVRRTCAAHGPALQQLFDARGHFNLQGLGSINPLELNQLMQEVGPLIQRAQAL